MKFYYNGELVRTSKTHVYTHAVLKNGHLLSCSSSLALAEKAMAGERSRLKQEMDGLSAAIKAIEAGRDWFDTRFHGRSYRAKVKHPVEKYQAWLGEATAIYNEGFEIVELEGRA